MSEHSEQPTGAESAPSSPSSADAEVYKHRHDDMVDTTLLAVNVLADAEVYKGSDAFLRVIWQTEPKGQGATVEDVIHLARTRLAYWQAGPMACDENAEALHHLDMAVSALNRRTMRRQAEGTEGTMRGH